MTGPAVQGMTFDTWEPVYERILADFGFDRGADERARDRLDTLCERDVAGELAGLDFTGRRVAIAGAAAQLSSDLDVARSADTVVAASTAADRLREAEIEVDLQVTDLDGNQDTTRELTAAGVPAAVHAHGDNISALEEYVPRLDHAWLLPTTQAAPAGAVANYGGFTDGDRAAFLADALGAEQLVFPGWAFDDPDVSEGKRRKLRWAERLLFWLERRRGERFEVLDDRREGIDTSVLPL